MENRHNAGDLAQMQSLPFNAKLQMTKLRIRDWYENWHRFEIVNEKTGHIRYVAVDVRDKGWDYEPELRNNEYVKAEYPGAVYISFSGGKDSTVLKHIVDSMYDDVPSLFVNTGLEYPEIQKFAMSQNNVEVVRPKQNFNNVIQNFGYPMIGKETARKIHYARRGVKWATKYFDGTAEYNGRPIQYCIADKYKFLKDVPFDIGDQCCHVMKKSPAHIYGHRNGRVAIVGTMASESFARRQTWIRYGCNAWESGSSKPLSFWSEQDVYTYIILNDLEICSVYGEIIGTVKNRDEVYSREILRSILTSNGKLPDNITLTTTGVKRTGCIFCGFGAHLEKEPNRFQMLKETHPKQYNYCINGGSFDEDGLWKPDKNGLGLGYVLDTIGVNYK